MASETLVENINQDEQLDISIERVGKINSPLLVLGLGGTGSDIVHTIKRTFAERYILPRDKDGHFIPIPEKTAYLVIDTAMAAKGTLNNDEFVDISLTGIKAILAPDKREFNLESYERKWVNRNLDAASSGVGAGTYRQAARFMLLRNYTKVHAAIESALRRIVTVSEGESRSNGRTEIVIATGISGGTGSGIFLDIAQIVRHVMSSSTELKNVKYHITSYIIMPDLSISNIRNASAMRRILEHNGFAALKELDFWMRVDEHKTPYVAQFNANTRISWTMPPFDACILMSGTTVGGAVYDNAYRVAQRTIAENLLHYLADENVKTDDKGTPAYTYIQYEDNLDAQVQGMGKRLPVFYGYRAIGAYTKRIPKKKVLYYEGTILFKKFIPQRDANLRLVPSDALFSDGRTAARAQEIVRDIKALYMDFSSKVDLPPFCKVAANDRDRLDRLRNMRPEPHECADAKPLLWRETVVQPKALQSAQQYLEGAWERFASFARDVITDPDLGPFSLQMYLQDGMGLYKALEDAVIDWSAKEENFRSDEIVKLRDCQGSKWNDFKRPPLLGAGRAINAYLTALNDYYGSVRRYAFMVEYARAIKALFLRVREFVRDSLDPLCEDLLRLEKAFGSTAEASNRLESDIFSMDAIRQRIDREMELSDSEGRVVRGFLGDLCDACFASASNADPHSSGVTFTYRDEGMDQMLETVRVNLDKCFGTINGQSLDSIMEQAVGSDPGGQLKYMDDLAQSVLNSASPMFSEDPAYANEPYAPYSYLSIPGDAVKHFQRYKDTLGDQNVEPKSSMIRDHIYCINARDGLPLYRYSQMEALEKSYEEDLADPTSSMGMHLVWDGDLDSDYTSNWTKLPSPRPYYFFAPHGQPYAEKWYKAISRLVSRARACGLVEVDTHINPVFSLNLLYADAQHTLIKSSNMIRQELDVLINSKDPTTGGKLQPDQIRTAIEHYLKSDAPEKVTVSRSPECLAPFLGLQGSPCNPKDANISANPTLVETAKKNHELLCAEMAAAVISMHPKYVSALEQQVEGWEYAFGIVKEIIGGMNIWEPRIGYANQTAQFMVYGIIRPSMKGFKYVSNNEDVQVIQEQLLKADIQNEAPLVKCAAHLGDLLEDNRIRFELEQLLKERQESITKRDSDGTLSREDIGALQKNVKNLLDMVNDEQAQYKAMLRKQNADTQKITSIQKMLEQIAQKANEQNSIFSNTLKYMA
jgi:hypothetical protein